MSEAASWEPSFVRVTTRPGAIRRLPLEGVLVANDGLEEVRLSPARGTTASDRAPSVRAFLVQGEALSSAGLQRGDYLLVDVARVPEPEGLVLARVAGRPTLQCGSALREMEPPCDIVGTFVGIIRRKGFPPRCGAPPSGDDALTLATARSPSRQGILRSQLSMLEATRATTRNPRLRRALRNEAEMVRKQLQISVLDN